MPVVDDPERPDGRLLLAPDGRAVVRFVAGERDGRPLADLAEPVEGVLVGDAVGALLAELSGWRIAGDPALGRALIAAGATPRRHAHVMSRDLERDPAPAAWCEPAVPAGYRLTAIDRPAGDLKDAFTAAYPPGHPDYADIPNPDRPELELDDHLSGRAMGPLLDCSGLAVAADGRVAGAVLVNGTPDAAPFGGPWISDIFRHPDAPGLGGPLLRRALGLATRDGLASVGLAVTHANPGAMRLYAAHGFADRLESVSVDAR